MAVHGLRALAVEGLEQLGRRWNKSIGSVHIRGFVMGLIKIIGRGRIGNIVMKWILEGD